MSIWNAIGSVVGGFMNADAQEDAARKQNKMIERMNKAKIRWTVNDARQAGIHPLAALGSPVAGSWATPVSEGATGLGDAVGAGIAEAGNALSSAPLEKLRLEHAQLSNDALRSDIRRTDADTARILADATSRTVIGAARRAGQSISTDVVAPGIGLGPGNKTPDLLGWEDGQASENKLGEPMNWPYNVMREIVRAGHALDKILPGRRPVRGGSTSTGAP